jgi:hypothetical protein
MPRIACILFFVSLLVTAARGACAEAQQLPQGKANRLAAAGEASDSKSEKKQQSPAKRKADKEAPVKAGTGKAGTVKAGTVKAGTGKAGAASVSAAQEAAALAFADQHHPELAALLASLRQSNPVEYARAIRELFRTSERLALLREKAPRKYALELEIWKGQSRIRLLAARLTMAPDPALEQELREAVAAQTEIRLQLLELEREELAARLEKLDAAIEAVRKSPTGQVDDEVERVLRKIGQSRAALKSAAEAKTSSPRTRKKSKPTASEVKAEADASGAKAGQD